jgi:hypothetical protein
MADLETGHLARNLRWMVNEIKQNGYLPDPAGGSVMATPAASIRR